MGFGLELGKSVAKTGANMLTGGNTYRDWETDRKSVV